MKKKQNSDSTSKDCTHFAKAQGETTQRATQEECKQCAGWREALKASERLVAALRATPQNEEERLLERIHELESDLANLTQLKNRAQHEASELRREKSEAAPDEGKKDG